MWLLFPRDTLESPLYSHGREEQQPVLTVCQEGGVFAATDEKTLLQENILG